MDSAEVMVMMVPGRAVLEVSAFPGGMSRGRRPRLGRAALCHTVVLGLCIAAVAPAARAAIPPVDRNALVTFYAATFGDFWFTNTGWLGPVGTECSWFGISCDASQSAVIGISLYDNNVHGSLPPELGDLSSLAELSLARNGFGGSSIPPELGNLAALRRLDLSVNDLGGSIPPELGNLASLEQLYLQENRLSGIIPVELGNLTALQELELSSNQLSGSIPPELGNLSSLQYLALYFNQLSGSIPPELGNLSSLQYLALSINPLSGSIPPELGNLSSLEELGLGSDGLSGRIPPDLGNLASLQSLDLGYNQLSGTIPPELGSLTLLESLSLGNNQLSGTIPPELGSLSSLVYLWMSDNQLSGTIPPALGNLSSLEVLTLTRNQLSGIAPQLGNLGSLRYLELGVNRLSGNIPPEIGNLSSLEYMSLGSNQLGGSIPRELANLSNLNTLDLRWNALYTSDPVLNAFLVSLQPGWALKQTIAPTNVGAGNPTRGSVEVTWTPILYDQDPGGYRVKYSTTSGGPYTVAGMTSDKTASSLTIAGLTCGDYYFVVESQTDPNPHNANTVVSELSAETSASTTLTLSPASLPRGTTGVPYTQTITASGGVPPYTFAVTSGTLPAGLSLSPTGVLSGTPTASGTSFVVTSTDAAGCSGSQPYDLFVDPSTDYIAGEGPGVANTNRVRIYTRDGLPTSVDFQAFGAGKWGTKVSSGDVNGGTLWEVLAGPGPGDVYGPQVRAFAADGTAVAKVNFYAYGTLRFGVNPASGLLDGDTYHEMLSGPGPGAVFGPHVRGWNFDNVVVAPIAGINFFAYATLKFGVNVEDGDVDGDGFGEILTGPGPGQSFGPQVRGWNCDGATSSPIAGVNFLPGYTPAEYGVNVAGGDVDADGFAEIVTAPGPGPFLGARYLGFDYDGVSVTAMPGFEMVPFTTAYGGRLGLGDLTADGRWDLIVAAGPDPMADSRVEGWRYVGQGQLQIPMPFTPFGTAGYGYGSNVGSGMLGW